MELYRGKTLSEWKEYVKEDKQVGIRSTKYIIVLEELVEELSCKLEQHTNIKNEASVCPKCGCNKVQKLAGDNYSCMNAYCDWQNVIIKNSKEDQFAIEKKAYTVKKVKNKKALSDAMHEAHKNRK